MTQKVFDTDNADDMDLLWSIVPDKAKTIKKDIMGCQVWMKYKKDTGYNLECIKINWHDKTEITRPMQEATEADIGKICVFWDEENPAKYDIHYGILTNKVEKFYELEFGSKYNHCRRLTQKEIKELC